MAKYTRDQLWAFVHRADTMEKCIIAENWLRNEKHFKMVKEVGGVDLWDNLMEAIAFTCREISRMENIARMKPEYRAQYYK